MSYFFSSQDTIIELIHHQEVHFKASFQVERSSNMMMGGRRRRSSISSRNWKKQRRASIQHLISPTSKTPHSSSSSSNSKIDLSTSIISPQNEAIDNVEREEVSFSTTFSLMRFQQLSSHHHENVEGKLDTFLPFTSSLIGNFSLKFVSCVRLDPPPFHPTIHSVSFTKTSITSQRENGTSILLGEVYSPIEFIDTKKHIPHTWMHIINHFTNHLSIIQKQEIDEED